MLKGDEKAHERLAQLLPPSSRHGERSEMIDPRHVARLSENHGSWSALGAGHAKFVEDDGGEIGIERAREMRAVVEEAEQRLGDGVNIVAAGVVRPSVDVPLVVAGFAGEPAERPCERR